MMTVHHGFVAKVVVYFLSLHYSPECFVKEKFNRKTIMDIIFKTIISVHDKITLKIDWFSVSGWGVGRYALHNYRQADTNVW